MARGEEVCIGDVLRLRRWGSESTVGANSSGMSLGGETEVGDVESGEKGAGGDGAGGVRRREGAGGLRGDENWQGGMY
jgi:hypothetical protein